MDAVNGTQAPHVEAELEPTPEELRHLLQGRLDVGPARLYFGNPVVRARNERGSPVARSLGAMLLLEVTAPCRSRAQALLLARAIELAAEELP